MSNIFMFILFYVMSLFFVSASEAGVISVNSTIQSGNFTESSHEYNCPLDYVLSGMAHSGGDDGQTSYWCSQLRDSSTGNLTANPQGYLIGSNINDWDNSTKQTYMVQCPDNILPTGRGRSGGFENSPYFICKNFYRSDGIGVTHMYAGPLAQAVWNGAVFECPQDWILISENHTGDSNGKAYISCQKLTSQ